MKPNLIVMCGLICSGKSTKANELKNIYNATIVSSDEIRLNYPGITNEKVFQKVYSQINDLLSKNINVILDATNTTIKSRRQIFDKVKIDCFKICYIINTSYSECYKRLQNRNNGDYPIKIQSIVLDNYYKSFEIPFYNEGWDEIKVMNKPTYLEASQNLSVLGKACVGFDQRNKHHTSNLDIHLQNTGMYLMKLFNEDNYKHYNKEHNNCLITAGYWHDIGKLFTQTFKEGDPNAHYYSHANIGAYTLLCSCGLYKLKEHLFEPYNNENDLYEYNEKKTLQWLFYINYHMHLYNVQTDKAYKKWLSIFGEDNYNGLKLLNEADKGSHIVN